MKTENFERLKINLKTNSRKFKSTLFVFCMLAFPVIHFFVFWLWANIDSVFLAFQNNIGEWVWFENIKWVFESFSKNPYLNMTEALKNTLIFFFWNLVVEMPIAVLLAYLFYKKMPGSIVFTVCLYLPCLISETVMTAVFKSFVGVDGPFALLLKSVGKNWTYPFASDKTALPAILVYNIWTGYGLNIILFRGAMSRIPKELFEVASLDGATSKVELTQIIIPLIWPTLSTMLILAVAGIFSASGPILLFTKGEYGTMTIGFSMFMQYKEYNNVVRATAIGLIFTLIGIPLVFLSRWAVNKIGGEYEY